MEVEIRTRMSGRIKANFIAGDFSPRIRFHYADVGHKTQFCGLAASISYWLTSSSRSSYAAKASKIPIGESIVAS